jgi:CRP-like cAMP-binding protein
VQLAHLGQAAACNLVHPLERRCARWLLALHDQVGQTEFPLTQDVLAQLLGVRRASVTLVAGSLQQQGLIAYHRGRMTTLDRLRLEAVSCACYRVIVQAADRFLPRPES